MVRAFITRHSIKPKGEDKESSLYPGISESGVKLARERARDISGLAEKSESNSVIFIGGATDLIRTKSTARVYGDELKELLKDRKDYIVITSQDIDTKKYGARRIREIVATIKANPYKKVIIDYPLLLSGLSPVKNGITDKKGSPTPYFTKLLEKHNNNLYKAIEDWIENKGKLGDLQGPDPAIVAKNYSKAIEKLESFVKKYVGDRPVTTGLVGHGGEMDVFLTYLAGGGKIDVPAFERIAKESGLIKETELVYINFNPGEKTATFSYHGKNYVLEHKGTKKPKLSELEAKVSVAAAILSFLFSIFFLSSSFTGFTVANLTQITSNWIGAILFITGIIASYLYFKAKK